MLVQAQWREKTKHSSSEKALALKVPFSFPLSLFFSAPEAALSMKSMERSDAYLP
jgi:hypothetical protein